MFPVLYERCARLARVFCIGMLVLCSCARQEAPQQTAHVELELFMMSKCPFSWELLREALPVVEQVQDRVKLRLHFVAKRLEGGFETLHGQDELQGDRVLACAQEIGGTARAIPFFGCMGRTFERMPEGFQACAELAKIDVAALSSCTFGQRGNELIAASFALAERRGVTASPSLFVNGAPYSGGRAAPFIANLLCTAMGEPADGYCRSKPEPVRVRATLVTDKRCRVPQCDATSAREYLRYTLAGLELEELDWSNPRARKLVEDAQATRLPLVAIDREVTEDKHAIAKIRAAATLGHAGEHFYLHVGNAWDPHQGMLMTTAQHSAPSNTH